MDNRLDTFTNNESKNLSRDISMLEIPGSVKPSLDHKNLILMGGWICSVMLTTSLSIDNNYNLSTTLKYPDKETQAVVVYEPSLINDTLLADDEINNAVFVSTQPEKSYPIKLKITQQNIGEPVIDLDNES